MKKLFLLIVIIFILPYNSAYAHPGRTDSKGGHVCKTNCEKWGLKIGEYHIHQIEPKTAPKVKLESKTPLKIK